MKQIFTLFFIIAISISSRSQNIATSLNVGDTAPKFSGIADDGNLIDLQTRLDSGKVVLVFYRGQWCPYCNKQLKMLEDSLEIIQSKGASIIAITPETSDNVKQTKEKTKAEFSIISDVGLKIMKAYKVAFDLEVSAITKYKKYGIDFDVANGTNGAVLPVPAVYIINKDGIIIYKFFDENFKKRASVSDIIDHL